VHKVLNLYLEIILSKKKEKHMEKVYMFNFLIGKKKFDPNVGQISISSKT
jgi:hypothetical protein